MSDLARDPAWERLLRRARRSFERTGGRLDTSIFLDAPSEDERLLVIGITGVHRAPGVHRVTVRLSELDAYLLQAHGRSLQSIFGPALRNRPAERSTAATARETLLAQARGSRHDGADWFERWLRGIQQDGSVARLIRAGRDLAPVLTVLDALPAADEPMPAFAERLLGDTKALGDGALRGLLLRAVALWRDIDLPGNAEEERALWEAVGVIPDDLASQVLVLNLHARGGLVGGWLAQAAQVGVPLRLTLHQLRMQPIQLGNGHIYVTENPAVLRAACNLGPHAAAMVCTEGVPSAAAHLLLRQATSARLWWRNDFDWTGVRITGSALDRYPNARPWRMAAQDYLSAADTGQPLLGTPAPTPWDPQLAVAMTTTGRSVMEERLLPVLLEDVQNGSPWRVSVSRR